MWAKGGSTDTLKAIAQETGASLRTVKSMSAAFREIWEDGAGMDPAAWTWAVVLFRNRAGGAGAVGEAARLQKRAEGLRDALLRGGFKPTQHVAALVEALALIDPALPNRVGHAIRKANYWAFGGEDSDGSSGYPFTSDDDARSPDF